MSLFVVNKIMYFCYLPIVSADTNYSRASIICFFSKLNINAQYGSHTLPIYNSRQLLMHFKKLLQTSPMSDQIFFVLLAILFIHPLSASSPLAISTSRITVVGAVFCDTCSTNTFSKHSYFLPGVDVHVQCIIKDISPKTTEQIAFSVNRTTDKYGVYKLEIPHVDGVDCVDGMALESKCQASLIGSSSSTCNVPGLNMASNEISVKSKQDSLCIYSLKALSYKPSKRNVSLCGNFKEGSQMQTSLNSSKFFLP